MSHTFFFHAQNISLRLRLNSDGYLEHECERRLYRSTLPVESTAFRQLLMSNTAKGMRGMYNAVNPPFEFKIMFDNGDDAYFFKKVQPVVPPTKKQRRAITWALLTNDRIGRIGLFVNDDLMAAAAKKATMQWEWPVAKHHPDITWALLTYDRIGRLGLFVNDDLVWPVSPSRPMCDGKWN